MRGDPLREPVDPGAPFLDEPARQGFLAHAGPDEVVEHAVPAHGRAREAYVVLGIDIPAPREEGVEELLGGPAVGDGVRHDVGHGHVAAVEHVCDEREELEADQVAEHTSADFFVVFGHVGPGHVQALAQRRDGFLPGDGFLQRPGIVLG
ncbi:hypothetical protein PG984_014360 [Apiospora sp. TS-2023a]